MAHLPKYSLHLFAGAGGGLLADLYHDITPIVAVEIEEAPRQMLLNRFRDLIIWDDVTTFAKSNPDTKHCIDQLCAVAPELVISGGFPCQDISSAGRGAGICGKKSGLWFEFARIVGEIRPGFVYVENSDQLVSRGLDKVLGELAAMGYNAAWGMLGAADMGAWHRRNRIWITAVLSDTDLSGR